MIRLHPRARIAVAAAAITGGVAALLLAGPASTDAPAPRPAPTVTVTATPTPAPTVTTTTTATATATATATRTVRVPGPRVTVTERVTRRASRDHQRTTAPAAPSGTVWDRLAACESSGDWHANTGNGFYGGVQFTLSSWRGVGGTAYAPRPDLATRSEQIAAAKRLLALQGWGAWPACSRKIGMR